MGEDLVQTELVVPAGHQLRPADLGALAAAGYMTLLVWRRPRVAIIPTGSELVHADAPAAAGEIPEFNSITLAAQVQAWGGVAERFVIVPDDQGLIREAVSSAAVSHDLILLNAGSSAGSEDYTARVIEGLGEVLVHGIAVRPGHPVVIGMVDATGTGRRRTPILGVPGYPVSAALTGELIVEPLLLRWSGLPPSHPETIEAILTRKVHSTPGDLELLRVTVGRQLASWPPRSPGPASSRLVRRRAGTHPSESGPRGGERSRSALSVSAELERTIVASFHDLTLDLMAFLGGQGIRPLGNGQPGQAGGIGWVRHTSPAAIC
jgi:putative molybdopterin biosynthesis protein